MHSSASFGTVGQATLAAAIESAVGKVDATEGLIENLRGGGEAPLLWTLATGVNEFDLLYDGSLYYMAYDNGTTTKLRSAATLALLGAATDTTPIVGGGYTPRYPAILFDGGIWHLWTFDQAVGEHVIKRWTATSFAGTYTYQDTVVDGSAVEYTDFAGGAVRKFADGFYYMACEDTSIGSTGRRICTLRATSPAGPWTNLGYTFGVGNAAPYAQQNQENDPHVFEWNGRRYMTYAGFDGVTQRVYIVELNASFTALSSPVCIVNPLEPRNTTGKVFAPCWEPTEQRLYYSDNLDHATAGWSYVEMGNPPDDGRRNTALVQADFDTGIDLATGIPLKLHGAATRLSGRLINTSSTGGAMGFLSKSSITDLTILLEFNAAAFPTAGNSVLLARIGPNAVTNPQVKILLTNTAGTVNLVINVRGNSGTYDETGATALTVGTGYSVFLRKSGLLTDNVKCYLNGTLEMDGTVAAAMDGMECWSLANNYTGTLTDEAGITAGSNYEGVISKFEVFAEALPLEFAKDSAEVVSYYAGGTDVAVADGGTGQSTAYAAQDAFSVHGADIASATTLNLDAATGNLVDVTGTTAITAITLADGRERTVRFTGALTLTHGASLVLPGAANITTVAGDMMVFRGYAAGVVRCVSFSAITNAMRFASGTTTIPVGTVLALADTTDAADTNTGGIVCQGGIAAKKIIRSLTGLSGDYVAGDGTELKFYGSTAGALGTFSFNGAIVPVPDASSPALNAGAAISVTSTTTAFALNGVNALTLANGTNGQIKTVICSVVTAAGTGTLTPATPNGFATITFTAVGQSATLQYFTVGGWAILSVRGATVA